MSVEAAPELVSSFGLIFDIPQKTKNKHGYGELLIQFPLIDKQFRILFHGQVSETEKATMERFFNKSEENISNDETFISKIAELYETFHIIGLHKLVVPISLRNYKTFNFVDSPASYLTTKEFDGESYYRYIRNKYSARERHKAIQSITIPIIDSPTSIIVSKEAPLDILLYAFLEVFKRVKSDISENREKQQAVVLLCKVLYDANDADIKFFLPEDFNFANTFKTLGVEQYRHNVDTAFTSSSPFWLQNLYRNIYCYLLRCAGGSQIHKISLIQDVINISRSIKVKDLIHLSAGSEILCSGLITEQIKDAKANKMDVHCCLSEEYKESILRHLDKSLVITNDELVVVKVYQDSLRDTLFLFDNRNLKLKISRLISSILNEKLPAFVLYIGMSDRFLETLNEEATKINRPFYSYILSTPSYCSLRQFDKVVLLGINVKEKLFSERVDLIPEIYKTKQTSVM